MNRRSKPHETAKALRIGAYIRVSTQRQATEGDSLEAQENEIRKALDWKKQLHNWTVASLELFREAGKSAKDQDRPELQRLISQIEMGQLDVVICSKLDRLTRSVLDFSELWGLSEFLCQLCLIAFSHFGMRSSKRMAK